jgi:spore maturation protein CgeB
MNKLNKKICSLGTSPLMIYHLLPAFKQLGYDTCNFPHRDWMGMNYNEGLKVLESDLKDSKCNLFIFGGNYPNYFLEIPDLCKKYNCKFMYWCIEDPVCFDYNLKLALSSDFLFTTTIECIEKYKKHGKESELLLFACNPNYHKPGKFNSNYNYDCVLQASYYVWKNRLEGYDKILYPLFDFIDNISVWGFGWNNKLDKNQDKFKGYFPNNLLGDLCESSKIILGVQCDGSSETQISMRPFEVLACGGFHLTQYTKATENIFENGKHLYMSNSINETCEIAKYFLNSKHENERNRIRMCGMDYVRSEHTYLSRVKNIILPFVNKMGGF